MVEFRIAWSFCDRCDFHFSNVCLKKVNAHAEVCSRHLSLSGCRDVFCCEEGAAFSFSIHFVLCETFPV